MKKFLIAAAIVAVAGVVQAGDYHQGTGLRCSQCHTMHASRAHAFEAYTDGRPGTGFTPQARTPNDRLLIEAGTNATCLSCHCSGAADVYGIDHTGTYTSATRSAGALNGVTGTWTPGTGYNDSMGHTLDSTIAPPGADAATAAAWGTTTRFNCADCHEVHGSAYYRNLAPRYGVRVGMEFDTTQSPTYSVAAAIDYTVDVTESASEEYDSTQVWFATAGGANRMNAYCGKCHGDFHSASGTVGTEAGTFKRHPTSGTVVSPATTHVNLLIPDQANSEIRHINQRRKRNQQGWPQ